MSAHRSHPTASRYRRPLPLSPLRCWTTSTSGLWASPRPARSKVRAQAGGWVGQQTAVTWPLPSRRLAAHPLLPAPAPCTHAGDRTNGQPNCGYDDSRGDYLTVVRGLPWGWPRKGWLAGWPLPACALLPPPGPTSYVLASCSVNHHTAPPPHQMGDHVAYRYEVTGVLGRGSFGQVR